MTSNEFNEKYKDHLEEGFEGLVFSKRRNYRLLW